MRNLLDVVVKKLESSVPKYSLIGDSIFFDLKHFPWAKKLEANWTLIGKSLIKYCNTQIHCQISKITPTAAHC